MVSIHVRPPEIEDRLLRGHCEGDFIKGAGNQSSVGVLVERTGLKKADTEHELVGALPACT